MIKLDEKLKTFSYKKLQTRTMFSDANVNGLVLTWFNLDNLRISLSLYKEDK